MSWTLALNLLCTHHSEKKIIKTHILSFVTYCIEEGRPEFQVTQEILMCGMWGFFNSLHCLEPQKKPTRPSVTLVLCFCPPSAV